MDRFIDLISIRNFKSIRSCDIDDCKRINLFIGRPNVGKSNILEALSLFSVPYLRENTSKKLSNLIRLEHEGELFHKGEWGNESNVNIGFGVCHLRYHPKELLLIDIDTYDGAYLGKVDDKLAVTALDSSPSYDTQIKKYQYKQEIKYKKGHAQYLIPPFGFNLLTIIEQYDDLRGEVLKLFHDYGLEVAFDKASQSIKIIQRSKNGIFLIPYNSIADTLQRIIFYKAAIASNTNSILLFEEPEAHSFPPYMSHLTQEMIYRKDNQFFVATHSPYILNDLLENARKELAVYIVDFKDGQTIVHPLSEQQLHEVSQYGVDLFTNYETFL